MSIQERYNEILERKDAATIRSGRKPEEVTLMAVTKTHPASELNEVIAAGATDIGENKVQEVLEKFGTGEYINALMGTALALYRRYIEKM